jgi:hypothetical protein
VSWATTAREKQRAPIGQYKPKAYRVVVYDTFAQYKLRRAALVIRNGMDVPEFLLFCADYVLTHHRELKRFRSIFRKGAKDIKAAVPEDREEVFERFARWAEGEL